MESARSVSVRVPASTANLGSGYDAFALALELHNTVRAEPALRCRVARVGAGRGRGPCADGRRQPRRPLDGTPVRGGRRERGADISCVNGIPFGRGLGSSSAAIVGGLVAGNELLGRPVAAEVLFRLAAELEGHPDNVAAALYGGFTICWAESGEPRVAHVDPPQGLAAVLVVSDVPLSTKRARALLPHDVPHADAAYDAGRAGLLATGIALGRRDLIGPGMSDRLHEQYRAVAVTDLEVVREALLAAGADGAALSGAGPSVVGLVAGEDDREAAERAAQVAERAAVLLRDVPGRRDPEVLMLDRDGASVLDS